MDVNKVSLYAVYFLDRSGQAHFVDVLAPREVQVKQWLDEKYPGASDVSVTWMCDTHFPVILNHDFLGEHLTRLPNVLPFHQEATVGLAVPVCG